MSTANDSKLGELILYVAERCEGDPDFGATKLNKILFYADFVAYAKRGGSITGQEYQRLPNGPAPRRLVPVIDKLTQEGAAVVRTRDHFPFQQKRTIALREPNLKDFTGEEIAIVEQVIHDLRGMGAASVSDLSHRFIGWQVARQGETIPYETVFVDTSELTEAEARYALELTNSDAG
jgi:Antitoxin SocA-like, Panacea domain